MTTWVGNLPHIKGEVYGNLTLMHAQFMLNSSVPCPALHALCHSYAHPVKAMQPRSQLLQVGCRAGGWGSWSWSANSTQLILQCTTMLYTCKSWNGLQTLVRVRVDEFPGPAFTAAVYSHFAQPQRSRNRVLIQVHHLCLLLSWYDLPNHISDPPIRANFHLTMTLVCEIRLVPAVLDSDPQVTFVSCKRTTSK